MNRTSTNKGRINLRSVAEVLSARGLDPTVEIVNILEKGDISEDLALRTWMSLQEYVHPKRKAVEVSGPGGGAIRVEQISDADLLRIAMQETAEEAEDAVIVERASPVNDGMVIDMLPAPGREPEIDPLG